MLSSTLIFLNLAVLAACNPQELMIIVEVVSARIQNDGTLEVAALINLEWNTTQGKMPHVHIEHLLSEKRSSEVTEELPENAKRLRYFSLMTTICERVDFSHYPWDSHTCQLRFLASQNSSRVIFLPHTVEATTRLGSDFNVEHTKAFVQWLQSGDQSYEMAVFEISTKRIPGSIVAAFWIAFFLNVLAICNHFPFLTDVCQPSKHIGCWVVLVQALLCLQMIVNAPPSMSWPNSVKGPFLFFSLSVIICVLASLIPPLVLHLHLMPFEAHPSPSDVPVPSEHLSLDSERTRLSAALDSARLDSSRTRRSENVELCMAELKYTLASLNETMNAKATAAWRRKLWTNGYGRVETALAVILHGANAILLLLSMH